MRERSAPRSQGRAEALGRVAAGRRFRAGGCRRARRTIVTSRPKMFDGLDDGLGTQRAARVEYQCLAALGGAFPISTNATTAFMQDSLGTNSMASSRQ